MSRKHAALRKALAFEPLEGTDLRDRSTLLYAYRDMAQNVPRPQALSILGRHLGKEVTSSESLTVCWIARFKELGCVLNEETDAYFHRMLPGVRFKQEEGIPQSISSPATQKRPSVSENALVAELDDLLDSGTLPSDHDLRMKLTEASLKDRKAAEQKYASLLKEMIADYKETMLPGGDSEVIWSKDALQELPTSIKVLRGIVSAFSLTEDNRKRTRKPRKVNKAKAAQKLQKAAMTIPCLKSLDGYQGLTPAHVIGKSTVWTYDTNRKRIRVMHAKEGGFTLRRTMIENVKEAFQKRTSKPKGFMEKLTPAAMLKRFEALRGMKEDAGNRLNDRTIILRVA